MDDDKKTFPHLELLRIDDHDPAAPCHGHDGVAPAAALASEEWPYAASHQHSRRLACSTAAVGAAPAFEWVGLDPIERCHSIELAP
jgi:hypothetical protein